MAKKDKKEIKNSKDKTSFAKGFKAELKKVIWPTPKQLFNNTVAVLSIVLITALIVFVLDLAFESINKYGIDKVKQKVSNSIVNDLKDVNTDNEEVDRSSEQNTENNENIEGSNKENTENNNNIQTTENNNAEENTNNKE